MYTIRVRNAQTLLQSSLNLTLRQHNEIHDLIMHLSSGDDPSPDIRDWVHNTSSSRWCPASHGASVRKFLLNELSRKLRPFGGAQSPESIRNCYLKWIDAELKCSETNRIFSIEPPFSSSLQRRTVRRAQELIKMILGRCRVDKCIHLAGPGPGSSFFTEKNKTGQYYKYLDRSNLSFTPSSEQFLEELVIGDDLWRRALFGYGSIRSSTVYQSFLRNSCRTSLGNRLTTVPKTSDTSRPICIEPGLNLMLQKGVGTYLRRRRKIYTGIELDYQQEHHKHLVINEWVRIATIDLSSASDTIAYEFVKYMLPNKWFLFLDSLRSEAVQVPGGKWYYTQKFSSMGNGYTFELETLLFWALAQAASELAGSDPVSGNLTGAQNLDLTTRPGIGRVLCSCFGDDLIVTERAEKGLLDILDLCGFIVNTRKSSLTEKAFKESCGVYSLYGEELPVFNLDKLDTIQDLFVACNQLLMAARRLVQLGMVGLSGEYLCLREKLIEFIPDNLRFQGPLSSIMDSYLHSMDIPTLARRSHVSRLSNSLKKRKLEIVDQWSDHTLFVSKWSGATMPMSTARLIQLDLSQRYVVFERLAVVPLESRDSTGDYFGMSIYSLKDRRFTPAVKRGAVRVTTMLAVMSWDEVSRGM